LDWRRRPGKFVGESQGRVKLLFNSSWQKELVRLIVDDNNRPVKVSKDSSMVVSDLLRKSKDQKRTVFDNFYLKPHRTLKQQKKRRALVAKVKQIITDSFNKHHFIKNGEVSRQDKIKKGQGKR
jgi:hypothetical protein